MRTDFSETAFWQPHLLTDKDGSASIEFSVPDSVTAWNIWVHAITKDLKSGSINQTARTVKELMVRPYLPRFLREGDKAEIKVVVNNASDRTLKGHLNFDIIDPQTGKSIVEAFGLKLAETENRKFEVAAGEGANLAFTITAPMKVGTVAFKVTAISGDFSDGEVRPIPILPDDASRPITICHAQGQITARHEFQRPCKNDDPTLINEQMVVTLDAQLFYSVLSALPYLVKYPRLHRADTQPVPLHRHTFFAL